jgi:hypothetical protein
VLAAGTTADTAATPFVKSGAHVSISRRRASECRTTVPYR